MSFFYKDLCIYLRKREQEEGQRERSLGRLSAECRA